MTTPQLNPAVPRCSLCLAELHPGLDGRDHEPDCRLKPAKASNQGMNNGFSLDILQALYDSEINCEIRWLWDGGIDWKLFEQNSYHSGNARTVQEAVYELARAAITHFPDSDFAKRFPELKSASSKLSGPRS